MIAYSRHARLLRVCLVLVVAMPALGGCAAKLPKLPVCDGKHRRDANPYGTVLPGAPLKTQIAPPSAADPISEATPSPAPPPKTSAISPISPYSSC